ncbi:MAG: cell division protein FtsK [Candidatus Contendobacter odensis]|uniref:DNA translocase FtsK n=1 Tax=Candidatus Contendibacter odensensis TaxID=1400860 RepID=A0A2G6PE58_9GAMM|nr:MAG: cell division protein FtsK [Candidatus Contendobacter odensis]
MAQAQRIRPKSSNIRTGITRFIHRLLREAGFWFLVILALTMLAALYTFNLQDPAWTHTVEAEQIHNIGGITGAWFADITLYFLGYPAYLLPLGILLVAWQLFKRNRLLHLDAEIIIFRILGFTVMLASASSLAAIHWHAAAGTVPGSGSAGGLAGSNLSQFLYQILGPTGANLFLLLLFLASTTLVVNISWLALIDRIGDITLKLFDFIGGLVLSPIRLFKPAASPDTARPQKPAAGKPPVEKPTVNVSKKNPENPDPLDPLTTTPPTQTPLPFVDTTAKKTAPLQPAHSNMQQHPQSETRSAIDASRDEPTAAPLPSAETILPQLVNSPIPSLKKDKTISTEEDKQITSFELQTLIPAIASAAQPTESADATDAIPLSNLSAEPSQETMTPQWVKPQNVSTPPPPTIPSPAGQDGASPETVRSTVEPNSQLQAGHENASPIEAGITAHNAPFTPVVTEPSSLSSPTDVATPPPTAKLAATTPFREAAPVTPYSLPPLDLLDTPQAHQVGYSAEMLEEMSRQLEGLLKSFGIEVDVVAVEPGPVITRFEVQPAPGVKVNQISNLTKDLARGLSVISVRLVEIIPGKSVIGLEIPNQKREIVYLREVLESSAYKQSSAALTLSLGKDISGNPSVANLGKMPHLLVAGTTGSGKSVAINAMLLSLLYKAPPSEVRLILVDPKMLELSIYEDIPHLLTPVVTDMKEAANALRWCVAEMERRYRLMAALKVRNIAGFNRKVKDAINAGEALPDPLWKPEDDIRSDEANTLEPLPFIVIVIDELADMMMIVGKKVEELIARLAQKARAAGIHLILATQRPSVDVITGLIKANVPTRIAFQVSSRVDSRTILDQMGAEQLLGHGDMLYLPPGIGVPQRVHGAFVDDHEVNRVVEYLRCTGTPNYIEDVLTGSFEENGNGSENGSGNSRGDESDPLYDEAVHIVTETRRASVSGVQRRLRIGYNRAARLVEEMEAAGIVGPAQSNGSREVLVPPPS